MRMLRLTAKMVRASFLTREHDNTITLGFLKYLMGLDGESSFYIYIL